MRFALALALLIEARAEPFKQAFRVTETAEVLATLDLSSPNSDWAVDEREAALANISIDGVIRQHVMTYMGAARHQYPIFLGRLQPGSHEIAVDRNTEYSATGSTLVVHGITTRQLSRKDADYVAVAHAPILFARRNTVGKFTDIPLISYCEKINENGRELLQYTMIFSNEDGGTSTRALMARWGRTTDIEYIYRGILDPSGEVFHATIQGPNHEELEFKGQREDAHPLLAPVTDNNMVSGDENSPIRYQIAPVMVDLSDHPRESVMDQHPFSYIVMAKELIREGKLRAPGIPQGERVSDPRNYLFLDEKLKNDRSGVAVYVRLANGNRWYSSHAGRNDLAIGRDGWVRTTVELPPGTKPADVADIGFECMLTEKEARGGGPCELMAVRNAFVLGPDYLPQAAFWSMPGQGVEILAGQMITFRVAQRPRE